MLVCVARHYTICIDHMRLQPPNRGSQNVLLPRNEYESDSTEGECYHSCLDDDASPKLDVVIFAWRLYIYSYSPVYKYPANLLIKTKEQESYIITSRAVLLQ
jgi:hypothetical protein